MTRGQAVAENSKIEWCDHTFNPWRGCTAISPACDHCYAKTLVEGRLGGDFSQRVRSAASTWKQPLAWNRKAEKLGVRYRVFCASLADVFDNQVPVEWRLDLWTLIRETPHLDWLLLTKRPQNISRMLPPFWGDGWHNVWLGTTVENQAEADRRIPHLLAVPACVRFLSCEPLLGPIRLDQIIAPDDIAEGQPWLNTLSGYAWDNDGDSCPTGERIHWVICGGESGPGARPMHPDWARSLRDQCEAAGVPLLFKQWGEWAPPDVMTADEPPQLRLQQRINAGEIHLAHFFLDGLRMGRLGKKAAGRLLDGRTWDQFPKVGAA